MEKARAGLQAWQDGDLSALEELLDPDVELFWWEPATGTATAVRRYFDCWLSESGKASLQARSS